MHGDGFAQRIDPQPELPCVGAVQDDVRAFRERPSKVKRELPSGTIARLAKVRLGRLDTLAPAAALVGERQPRDSIRIERPQKEQVTVHRMKRHLRRRRNRKLHVLGLHAPDKL